MKTNNGRMSNPAVSKLTSFSSSVFGSENVATYGGVLGKIGFYMALILAGVISYFVLSGTNEAFAAQIAVGSLFIGGICGIISSFIPATCAVTGAIYAVCEGYTLTWLSMAYAKEFSGIAIMAITLTVLIVATMGFLYCKGIVTANQKLRAVCMTGLIVSLVGGIIFMLIGLIAPNSSLYATLTAIDMGPFGIILAVLGVVLAAFLLVFDFDTIAQTVGNGLEKKYEWYAAYGLVVGVIYVYIKVLNLLIKLYASNRN